MKQNQQKLKEDFQKLISEENEIQGQIALIEHQIDQLETLYLQRTWYNGNVYLGWNKNIPLNVPDNRQIKIVVDPKEKIFSLSSLSSVAFADLGKLVDRQLSPYGQSRFEPKKKENNQKKNHIQKRRPKSSRKKNRN